MTGFEYALIMGLAALIATVYIQHNSLVRKDEEIARFVKDAKLREDGLKRLIRRIEAKRRGEE